LVSVAHTGNGQVTIVTVKPEGGFFGRTGIWIGACVLTNCAYCAFAAVTAAPTEPDAPDELVLLPDPDELADALDEDELELELPHPASKKIVVAAIKATIADVVRPRRTELISVSPSRVAYIVHHAHRSSSVFTDPNNHQIKSGFKTPDRRRVTPGPPRHGNVVSA
jgi:hypothetical protein